MDRLPKAIQDEIWLYVRGDRAYWKQQFQPVIHDLTMGRLEVWGVSFDKPMAMITCNNRSSCVRAIVTACGHSLVCVYPWVSRKAGYDRTMGWYHRLKCEFPNLLS